MKQDARSYAHSGFSLVELSIVLVILGLLVGGVMTGQNLIRAAELRAVSKEFQEYQAASRTFQDKYRYVAGDLPNASAFWGAATTCPPTNAAPLTGSETCDGDGDGSVNNTAALGEGYLFWHHLAQAGMITGTYTGAPGTAGTHDAELNENVPASRLSNAGWSVNRQLGNSSGDGTFFAGRYRHNMMFGAPHGSNATYMEALKPEEAWNIDTKMDDGMPATGRVVASMRTSCTNSTAADDTAAEYLLSSSSVACGLVFNDGF